ncbi:riboflavin synthase [Rubellicoccus peritrichatus]|uniref:Riboflavin synthase n=1 Tax=Rubellicoccus peritrichatus TaxID=3080537 RepID=A0AAQ3LDC0_9BACT|nr:riboflavin synthase [Puniceicoccus sp. CR14]WOO43287.1 riboflavin synthase [Puniceicoccus sp. CR14]
MFTGLVEETGKVVAFEEGANSWKLTLEATLVLGDLAIGDSLACNGCCLTVTEIHGNHLVFDLLDETVRLTSFHRYGVGDLINLERSLAVGARMGGHFVSGHVDTKGQVEVFEERGKSTYLKVQSPSEFLKYLAYKGSITIDGISLTVAEVHEDGFSVWLIPHTIAVTNLHQRQVKDPVNLEFDLLAKYVERIVQKG